MDVAVKDSNEAIHQINTDVLGDGSETQAVKLQLGDTGTDGGYASNQNPLPIEIGGLFKLLKNVFGRFSFGTTSALRTEIANTPAVTISGTPTVNVTTLTAMTTGNIGYGDSGKTSTIMQTSAMMYGCAIRPNFAKA